MKYLSVKNTDMIKIADAIREKTGKTDDLTLDAMPAEISSIEVGGSVTDGQIVTKAIIDVVELPTENIREDCFYRATPLESASFIGHQSPLDGFTCNIVDSLPETGTPVTTDMTDVIAYFSVQDNEVYGYINDALSAVASVPAGWYTLTTLAPLFGVSWGGIITDIRNDSNDGTIYLLLEINYDGNFYIYKNNNWSKLIFAEEQIVKYDITWDGDTTNRLVLETGGDSSYVKVSDEILGEDELLNAILEVTDGDGIVESVKVGFLPFWVISSESEYGHAGATTIAYIGEDFDEFAIAVYDADALAVQLGIPTGIYTNGVYFLRRLDAYVSRLTKTYEKVKKIDAKYLDVVTNAIQYDVVQSLTTFQKDTARTNIDVYSKSEVDSRIANVDVDLSAYAKTSEVQTLIDTAIGTAIGGSY